LIAFPVLLGGGGVTDHGGVGGGRSDFTAAAWWRWHLFKCRSRHQIRLRGNTFLVVKSRDPSRLVHLVAGGAGVVLAVVESVDLRLVVEFISA
jgi:hypothetical protein